MSTPAMSSNRPYLLRAMFDWINDNGMTPYVLVDAGIPSVVVPPAAVKDGRIVLSIAPRAVARLEIGNERISFLARFGGISHGIEVPVHAVLAIYAQENGQGMMFPAESAPEPEPPPVPEEAPLGRPRLTVVK